MAGAPRVIAGMVGMSGWTDAADRAGAGLRDEALGAEGLAREQRERRPGRIGRAAIGWGTRLRHPLGEGRPKTRQKVALRQHVVRRELLGQRKR